MDTYYHRVNTYDIIYRHLYKPLFWAQGTPNWIFTSKTKNGIVERLLYTCSYSIANVRKSKTIIFVNVGCIEVSNGGESSAKFYLASI